MGHREGYKNVKKDSGSDLLQVWNAYAGEKPLWVPKGSYTPPTPLLVPHSTTYRNIIMEGAGLTATRILGDVTGMAGSSIIKSQQTAWYYTNLMLRNLRFSGVNVEADVINVEFVKNYWRNIRIDGKPVSGGRMLNLGGSGAAGDPSNIDGLNIRNEGTCGEVVRAWEENMLFHNIGVWLNGNATDIFRLFGVNIKFGNLSMFLSPYAFTNLIRTDSLHVQIDNINLAKDSTVSGALRLFNVDAESTVRVNAINNEIGPVTLFADTLSRENTVLDLYRTMLIITGSTLTFTDPNTAYVEYNAMYRESIDLTDFNEAKIVVKSASGNEAGSGKGICVYNITNGAVLCEVTWDGTESAVRSGIWANISALAGVKELGVYMKGSSPTEDISFRNVHLFLRK